MRRFTFPLEAALVQRQSREDAARLELAAALRGLEDCRARLQAKGAMIAAALAGAPEGSLSAGRLIDNRRWVSWLRRDEGELLHELGTHQARVQQRQEALGAAAREREALTRLKARRRAEWEHAQLVAEQAVIDEVASGIVRRAAHA